MFLCPITGMQGLVISEDMENLDLAKYVLGGRINMRIYVASGVTLGSATSSIPAIYSSREITGPSHIYIENAGNIWGCNGVGGDGYSVGSSGGAGGVGGDAIVLSSDLTIDNTDGYIWAGGGGGGCGGGNPEFYYPGGGGGGYPGGRGFPAGVTAQYGEAAGGASVINNGGACLGPGLDGEAGASGSGVYGRAGGAAGYSVKTSGNTITWLGGNNVDQVKGATN